MDAEVSCVAGVHAGAACCTLGVHSAPHGRTDRCLMAWQAVVLAMVGWFAQPAVAWFQVASPQSPSDVPRAIVQLANPQHITQLRDVSLVTNPEGDVRAEFVPASSVLSTADGLGIDAMRPVFTLAHPAASTPTRDRMASYAVVCGRPGESTTAFVARLAHESGLFISVEPDAMAILHGMPTAGAGDPRVADPLEPEQWSIYAPADGEPGGINAFGAWGYGFGAGSTTIAIIDTGVSTSHPDLMPVLLQGRNFVDGQDPTNTDGASDSHGTHVAGIAAAAANNGLGIRGLATNAHILPVKVFFALGFGFESWVASGIEYAADSDADVAVMSFGIPGASSALHDAVIDASGRGMLLVASSGNVATALISPPGFYPETITVGASTRQNTVWANSTGGAELDMVAPGEDILSTWDAPAAPDSYRTQTGTSMAAPHVAGVLALMIEASDRKLSSASLTDLLLESCVDLGEPGYDQSSGHGRLDATVAVRAAIAEAAQLECPADLAAPYGVLNFSDVQVFLAAFNLGILESADLAPPAGVLNLADLQAFLGLFGSCFSE